MLIKLVLSLTQYKRFLSKRTLGRSFLNFWSGYKSLEDQGVRAGRYWQSTSKTQIEQNPRQSIRVMSQIISDPLKNFVNVKKLDKGMNSVKVMISKRVWCCISKIWMNHFITELWVVLINETLMRVANERLNDLIMTKHSNTSQKRNLHKQNIMLTVLWSAVAIIHYSFLESTEVYSKQLVEMHI